MKQYKTIAEKSGYIVGRGLFYLLAGATACGYAFIVIALVLAL